MFYTHTHVCIVFNDVFLTIFYIVFNHGFLCRAFLFRRKIYEIGGTKVRRLG